MIEFITIRISEDNAQLVHELIADRLASTKNWLVSAVEDDQFERAKRLTKEARQLQELFAGFNVKVKREIAERKGVKPFAEPIVI